MPASSTSTSASTSASATGKLLLVDDSADSRDLLGELLLALGYTVQTAGRGEEALARVAEEAFDLIILDLMMPGMDGYEVLSRLKQDAGTRHVPVLVVSGYTELDSVVRCVQMGAEDYLNKPFDVATAGRGRTVDSHRTRCNCKRDFRRDRRSHPPRTDHARADESRAHESIGCRQDKIVYEEHSFPMLPHRVTAPRTDYRNG